MKFKVLLLLLLPAFVLFSQNKSILFTGITVHVGNGKVVGNAVLAINRDGTLGLIADVTTVKINASLYDTIIKMNGEHVYPGIIAPNNIVGLTEIDAVRATRDMNEVGAYNPHIRTVIAYNTDSKIIPTLRSNGVLLVEAAPRGGIISGISSVMQLDGWNWEDAVYKMDVGIHINYPKLQIQTMINEDEFGPIEKNKNYNKQVAEVEKFFNDAKAYSLQEKTDEKNIRFEAMKGLFDGSKILFIHADYVKDITESINFAKLMGIKRMVIVGGRDADLCLDVLKQSNVPVILEKTHALPTRADDDVHEAYKLPATLQKAGILFCISSTGGMQAANTRNLAFFAGSAAAYGLTKEEALSAITFNTAKILGIDARLGTVEGGKDATIVFSTGDILDMKSSIIVKAFMKGKELDLDNDQKQLYEKYKTKYGLK